jgi:hypothetical protein
MDTKKRQAIKLNRVRLKTNPAFIKDDMVYYKADGPRVLEAIFVEDEFTEELISVKEQEYWSHWMDKGKLDRRPISDYEIMYADEFMYFLFPLHDDD